jgi:DNA repair exonuclease SbcCD ATPase subunit
VTNANLSQLIDTVTEQLTQVKESLQSELNLLSNNLGMVVDDKLTKNSEQLKAVSQSIEKTANQFGSLKSDFSQVINAVNTNTSQLTANLESLRDKLEKVIAKENKSNQKMIEHIYGEIHKCLAELEKINDMRSDFSNLNNKMEELSEFSNLKDKIEKLKDEMEELFKTIPNPPQKDVEKGIKTIFDNFTNKF